MKFDQDPQTGSSEFLKIEPNQKVVGVFRGEPREFYAKFENNKSVECKSSDMGARFRCRLNFVTKSAEGEYIARIWEFGPTVYNQLKEINEDYQLENTVVSIKRNGEGLNTTYSVLPTPHKVPESIDAVELKPLVSQAEPDMSNNPPMPSDEDLPF